MDKFVVVHTKVKDSFGDYTVYKYFKTLGEAEDYANSLNYESVIYKAVATCKIKHEMEKLDE